MRAGAAAVVAGSGAALVYRALTRLPARARSRWQRTNHAGRPVTLLEGVAWAAGAGTGAAVAGAPGVVAVAGAAAFGALDDLAGHATSKGLRGHLGSLAHGEVTTGALKILGLGASGLLAIRLADRGGAPGGMLATLLGAGVVAGSANLANLLDLRPGRTLKVTGAGGLTLLASPGARPGRVEAAAALGASLALLPADLRGEAMLGDTGANAAGALVGCALARRLGVPGRLAALVVLATLTLASERVSFTAVIERTPVLRELDRLGRPRS